MFTNPYVAPDSISHHPTQALSIRDIATFLVWLTTYVYPLIALGGIYAVEFMHDTLGIRGAIIGSYKTPLGVAFNMSVWVLIGVLFVCPVGLIWSFFPPILVRRLIGSLTRVLPVGFVVIAALTIAIVFWDPWRVVESYQD
jgi:hypothetical protein